MNRIETRDDRNANVVGTYAGWRVGCTLRKINTMKYSIIVDGRISAVQGNVIRMIQLWAIGMVRVTRCLQVVTLHMRGQSLKSWNLQLIVV